MTFLEKYKKYHPNDNLDSITEYFCPYDFGYEKEIECKAAVNGRDKYTCVRCWEREMPQAEPEMLITKEDLLAMYNQGLKDAWELARKIVCARGIGGLGSEVMIQAYGTDAASEIFAIFSHGEAAARLNGCELAQKMLLEAGDIVEHEMHGKMLVTKVESKEGISALLPDGSTIYALRKDIRRTGDHINIAPVLDAIGK